MVINWTSQGFPNTLKWLCWTQQFIFTKDTDDLTNTLRGCLHVKFYPGMKLVPGWNHPCLWWNVSDCLHVFAEMKFHTRMNSSLSERQRWNFILGRKKDKKTCKHYIPGWSFKMRMFFPFIFDVCIQICFPKLTCLNIMGVWI